MLLSEGEFIGASIPQHLFLIRETCKQCQHPAHFTVLIIFNAGLGAEGPARKVPLCKNHWEQAIKEVSANPMKIPEYQRAVLKLVPRREFESEKAGCQ